MIKWGFDLTDFGSAESFKTLLKKYGLKKYTKKKNVVHYNYGDKFGNSEWHQKKPYHAVYYNYIWSKPGLKIVTSNNPLTGAYSSPKQREPQKGYASYIGIEGNESEVLALKDEIKKIANYKDESSYSRDFV